MIELRSVGKYRMDGGRYMVYIIRLDKNMRRDGINTYFVGGTFNIDGVERKVLGIETYLANSEYVVNGSAIGLKTEA